MADIPFIIPIQTRAWYAEFKTNKFSADQELSVPAFEDLNALNAYVPDRAGALAQVGTDMYRWDGAEWLKLSDQSSNTGSTYNVSTPNDLP